jgi:hypothetical protein
MNFIQLTQHVEQTHDAFQSYVAKAVNVGLTVYPQFFGTMSKRLKAMTIQIRNYLKAINN